ncbi:MAG: F0F1 ATP synthase subunit A [Rickettsiales bacterium]|nr:F0F1 ATP synthase subunit A [Rickettsiales bacterium]|tara:strand:+ start:854 stop:1585 length:732 start_codon:yes stop_codon:yes gene_type:complete
MADPLHQFEVQSLIQLPPLAGYNIDFTNASLFMMIAVVATVLLMQLGMRGRALVPGRWQSIVELSYGFVANTVKDNVGSQGRPYFPFIFTLFMFILMCNLLGMVPYSFTVTSHIIVTFVLAAFIFVGVTVVAIMKHGLGKFLGFFLPQGTPWWMAPMMYLIELFSYLARPVSLSVRLTANMMAGHTMLKVIAGFVVALGIIGGWAPLALLVILTGFEIFVAILQAYIFTVLTCVYLNDALHLH